MALTSRAFGFAAAMFAVVSLVSVSQANAAGATSILTVNTEQLFLQSKVGQSVRSQIQTMAQKIQAEGRSSQASLQDEANKLTQQRSTMAQEQFQQKVQDLQKREADLQARMQKKGSELQNGGEVARNQVETALRPIFTDLMTKHGADIIIDTSVIVASKDGLDVTQEAMTALNARLSTVTVTPTAAKP
ncbi:MAG: OmpH family outer membrane protein [Parvibaculaceae bacterium]|nr:OmpH family outer membrane protein [Parvibaculaceae bacterium]